MCDTIEAIVTQFNSIIKSLTIIFETKHNLVNLERFWTRLRRLGVEVIKCQIIKKEKTTVCGLSMPVMYVDHVDIVYVYHNVTIMITPEIMLEGLRHAQALAPHNHFWRPQELNQWDQNLTWNDFAIEDMFSPTRDFQDSLTTLLSSGDDDPQFVIQVNIVTNLNNTIKDPVR